MKIITGNSVYVQLKDLKVIDKLNMTSSKIQPNMISTNDNEFIKIEDNENKKFIQNQEWILDYMTTRILSEEGLFLECYDNRIEKYNLENNSQLSKEEKDKRIFLLNYKFDNLIRYYWYKKGLIKSKEITKEERVCQKILKNW